MRAVTLGTVLALLVGCGSPTPSDPEPGVLGSLSEPQPWQVRSLGSAQDAGMPHLDCFDGICEQARADGRHARVAALAVTGAEDWYLVDATPDLPTQVHAMGSLPAGILLTHAHIGHYTGLVYLGKEGINAQQMPVWCSEAMAEFLRGNAPWSQLVELGNIELRTFAADTPFPLEPGLEVTALGVPHRDEFADTHGFVVRAGGGRAVFYLPDIDRWSTWDRDPRTMAREVDALILDGTFYADGELRGRDMSAVPHPRVRRTMDILEDLVQDGECEVVFTHLNHTNPLWLPDSEESSELTRRGFRCTWPDGWVFALR